MNNLLITGGAGFIGANFVHYCKQNLEVDITVLDDLTYAGNHKSIECFTGSDHYRFIKGNICDEELVARTIRNNRINIIVHFAAESHVDRSISGPDSFIQTNILGTYVLLKCAKEYWLDGGNRLHDHRFHHVSTDEVFGSLDFDVPGFHESTPYAPSSPYSASKAASDHLVRAWHHTYGLNVTISNCSNNYGPYHYPEKLIPLSILNILHGKPVAVYGTGENIRDWLFVTDHCRGIDLILKSGAAGQTYNIGGLSEVSNITVVNMLCTTIDALFRAQPELSDRFPGCPAAGQTPCASLVKFVTDRPGHDLRYAMNISKIQSQLGFSPSESFESGLTRTVKWYIDNEEWWRALLSSDYSDWLKIQYG